MSTIKTSEGHEVEFKGCVSHDKYWECVSRIAAAAIIAKGAAGEPFHAKGIFSDAATKVRAVMENEGTSIQTT